MIYMPYDYSEVGVNPNPSFDELILGAVLWLCSCITAESKE